MEKNGFELENAVQLLAGKGDARSTTSELSKTFT